MVLVLCVAGSAAPVRGQEARSRLTGFLRTSIGLDSARVASALGGEVVVKVLPTALKRDVAVFGIAAVDVTRGFFVARVLDAATWLRAPTRPRFGVFSDPARPADVRNVTIDPRDVRELEGCRPGHCNVKLPASEMQRIHEDIHWTVDPVPEVDAYARQRMLAFVADYRARGDSAMVEYDDRGRVRGSDAFASLLAQSPYVYQYVAPLHHYLADYPHVRLDGVEDVLYWTEDALPGLRPILSITQLSVYAPPDRPGTTVVARKQIYADHYFEAGFDLALVVDRPAEPGRPRGIYLVVIRRYRFDNLPGGLFNIRGKVVGKLRDMMRRDLEREKETAEHAFAGSRKSTDRAGSKRTTG